MPRPGVTTTVLDDFSPAGPALNTGTGFIIGETEKGPANKPTRVTSFRMYKDTFGTLAGGADMYKAAYGFFSEGGLYLWVVRAIGSEAVTASGQATGWLEVEATSPGIWANDVTVELAPQGIPDAPEDSVKVVVSVSEAGELKERSIPLAVEDVPSFRSKLVILSEMMAPSYPEGDAPPIDVALTGGDDGGDLEPAEFGIGLDTLEYSMGPGQVAFPGQHDPEVHALLGPHCDKNHRVACADLLDSPDPADLSAAVQAIAETAGKGRQILSLGHRVTYPGEVAPAIWDVPYSGVQMGIIARVDGLRDPSQVAAGSLGFSRLAIGPKRDFTDDDRERLNYQGVTLAKMINGQFRTYGYRTSAGLEESNWVFFQESRVVMAVAHECDAAMEEFTFKTVDARGKVFTSVNVALTGVCQRYWSANALFGETPGEGFIVDTSYPGINTIETIGKGEIHAQVLLRTSRIAEWIALDIVKSPLERAIA